MIGSIVLGMSLVFGACGNQEDSSEESANEITVSTWNYETTPEFKALFEAFEKKTGIKVKAVDIASDDYDTKLTTMLSSGDTTDVLTMKNLLSYSNYALRDQLVDQTERIRDLDMKCMISMEKHMHCHIERTFGYYITIRKCLMMQESNIQKI